MSSKILAFAGSTRKNSWNKQLVKIAAAGAGEAGATVTFIDLSDYELPMFDEDLESSQGIPDKALELKELFKSHQGFLISSPEYNSSISAVLKNTIDWVSRPMEGEQTLEAFKGKVVSLMSASPGGLGGLRGLNHVRSILNNIGCIVLPTQVAIAKAHEAMSDGELVNPQQKDSILALGRNTAAFVAKLG